MVSAQPRQARNREKVSGQEKKLCADIFTKLRQSEAEGSYPIGTRLHHLDPPL